MYQAPGFDSCQGQVNFSSLLYVTFFHYRLMIQETFVGQHTMLLVFYNIQAQFNHEQQIR